MKTISLTQGYVAQVDDADYPAVSAHKWRAIRVRRRIYAVRSLRRRLDGKRPTQYLHRFLMLDAREEVDHIDGDGLNNRRGNLRAATTLQNHRGFQRKRLGATSEFRGVYWSPTRSKWVAQIKIDGKQTFLGHFSDPEIAARAYDAAAVKRDPKFCQPNFPINQR